jgi:hypothetical protein
MLSREEVMCDHEYTYKDNKYKVLRCDGNLMVKDANDSNWYHAVEYKAVPDDGRTYVRRVDDFCSKFDAIDPVEQ